ARALAPRRADSVMPDKKDFNLEADDDAFQIGQMSGGTVHMPRFVATLGPWGFLTVAVLASAAVLIASILVFRDGPVDAGPSWPSGGAAVIATDDGAGNTRVILPSTPTLAPATDTPAPPPATNTP